MTREQRIERSAAEPEVVGPGWEARLREELITAARRLVANDPAPAPAPGGEPAS